MRREYRGRGLDINAMAADPFAEFGLWLDAAREFGIVEPNAMVLATVDRDGAPTQRHVLLKGVDQGFRFFTNLRSRKAEHLKENPTCSLSFPWSAMARQVNIEGRVETLSDAANDDYFASRPRESQLGAWASEQSTEIGDRAVLEHAFEEATSRFEAGSVDRPPHWGGYLVVPHRIEFWQGGERRLHDRIEYTLTDSAGADAEWTRRRLAP